MEPNFPQQAPPPPPAPHAPTQAPPTQAPPGTSGFAPSVRTKGAERAKSLVLGLLAVFILLPLLAIFALTTLGRTVEEGASEIPNASGADVSQVDSPEVPVLAFDDVAVPADAQVYVEGAGAFSMAVDPSWSSPIVEPNVVTGLDSTFWRLERYSSSTFLANINVAHSVQPDGATLEGVAQAEIAATRAQLDVSNVEQRDLMVDGVQFRELTMDATLEGIDLTFYSVFRLDDGVVHMATLSTPSETAAAARLEVEPYLRTLQVPGATG